MNNFTFLMEKKISILIFKTNLHHPNDLNKVGTAMQQMGNIHRWSVDHEDTDRVLRVETTGSQAADIIQQLVVLGYQCEELTD